MQRNIIQDFNPFNKFIILIVLTISSSIIYFSCHMHDLDSEGGPKHCCKSDTNAIDLGEYYLVEGDIMIPKEEFDQYKQVSDRQYNRPDIVSRSYITYVRVRVDASIPIGGTDDWRDAVTTACQEWNDIDNSIINFVYTTSSSADITIRSDNNTLPNNQLGSATPSSGGLPGSTILINLDFDSNADVPEAKKIFNMVHELGHTIGFLHSNYTQINDNTGTMNPILIYGTPTSASGLDPNSVMNGNSAGNSWSSFTDFDKFAAQMLYFERYIPGNGSSSEGSDVALGNVGGSSAPDLVLMSYDAPYGSNSFRYRIVYDLDGNGIGKSYSNYVNVSGVGSLGTGSGMAIGNIGGSSAPDLVLMADDNPSGANQIRYRIAFDLNPYTGTPANVSNIFTVPGSMNWESQGAGCSLSQIDNNPAPDLLVMVCDNGGGINEFRYKIGWNINASGAATSWSQMQTVQGVSYDNEGAGVAIANIDGDSRPDIVFMGYDANNPNGFIYKIGWNMNTSGQIANWGAPIYVEGLNNESSGAGIAIGNVDGGALDIILMCEDNPRPWEQWPNHFRYKIGFDIDTNGETEYWNFH